MTRSISSTAAPQPASVLDDSDDPTLDELARACAARPAGVVLVSGSRVEGLGNARSD